MYWVLILVGIINGSVIAAADGRYDSMTECFTAREAVVKDLGDPPINYQAVCILVAPDK